MIEEKPPLVHDPVHIGATHGFLHNTHPNQKECLWQEFAVVVEVLIIPHLAALGSVCGSWCERRCDQGQVVGVDWRLSRSEG